MKKASETPKHRGMILVALVLIALLIILPSSQTKASGGGPERKSTNRVTLMDVQILGGSHPLTVVKIRNRETGQISVVAFSGADQFWTLGDDVQIDYIKTKEDSLRLAIVAMRWWPKQNED